MFVIKCDLCKKEIEKEPMVAGFGSWPKFQLCEECGLPISKFLIKNKLIDKNKKEIKEN